MNISSPIGKIGVVFAMEGEASAIISHFNLKLIFTKASIEIYGNDEHRLVVSLNGKCTRFGVDNIGTNAAVLNTYILCEEMDPDIIINAGTAGGFAGKGGCIGDVYVGNNKVTFHDRRIPLPLFEEYGIGNYEHLNTDVLSKALNLKQGIVSTGNSLDFTPKDLEILNSNQANLKDMEAASVAWVCHLLNKPFIALKSITDLVDQDMNIGEEFQKNFNLATTNLTLKLIETIDYLLLNYKD